MFDNREVNQARRMAIIGHTISDMHRQYPERKIRPREINDWMAYRGTQILGGSVTDEEVDLALRGLEEAGILKNGEFKL